MDITVNVAALSGEALQSLCVSHDVLGLELLELLDLLDSSHTGHVAKLLHGHFPLDNFVPLHAQGIADGSQLMLLWKRVSDDERTAVQAKLESGDLRLDSEDMKPTVLLFGFKMMRPHPVPPFGSHGSVSISGSLSMVRFGHGANRASRTESGRISCWHEKAIQNRVEAEA